jgi:plasmid stabilization system protein ParE
MAYQVLITNRALADIDAVLEWFNTQSASSAGQRWVDRVLNAIDSLEKFPERGGPCAEAEELNRDIREILVGRRGNVHRIIYTIERQTVYILRVWHAAREQLTRDAL